MCSSDLGPLTSREAQVLRLRYDIGGGEEGATLEAIGEILGVCVERVRQIEAKAMRKLRHPSRSRRLLAHFDEASVDELPTPDSDRRLREAILVATKSKARDIASAASDAIGRWHERNKSGLPPPSVEEVERRREEYLGRGRK